MRDARQLGINAGFDPYRLMMFTRVMRAPALPGSPSLAAASGSDATAAEGDGAEGRMTLAFKESEAWNIYELFHSRYTLHKRAYQHRTANCIEGMLCEVLALANRHVLLQGTDGRQCSLYDACWDMAAYTRMTDSIFQYVEMRTDIPELNPAREVLHKIHTRQHHRYVSESVIDAGSSHSKEQWKEECRSACASWLQGVSAEDCPDEEARAMAHAMTKDDLVVDIVKINYGKGEQNPVDSVVFYGRDDVSVGTTIGAEQVSAMIPHVFQERYLRLYSRVRDKRIKRLARRAFDAYRGKLPTGSLNVPTPCPSPLPPRRPALVSSNVGGGASMMRPSVGVGRVKKRRLVGGAIAVAAKTTAAAPGPGGTPQKKPRD
eukprot:SAG11_NODE_2804_length_2953_cov_4.938683_1_plen_375_part_00